jgi:hypothetical protein
LLRQLLLLPLLLLPLLPLLLLLLLLLPLLLPLLLLLLLPLLPLLLPLLPLLPLLLLLLLRQLPRWPLPPPAAACPLASSWATTTWRGTSSRPTPRTWRRGSRPSGSSTTGLKVGPRGAPLCRGIGSGALLLRSPGGAAQQLLQLRC